VLAVADPLLELVNGCRLVTGRLKIADDGERGLTALEIGDWAHSSTVGGASDSFPPRVSLASPPAARKGSRMAEIHKTTLSPSKLQLLTGWLTTQPWYVGEVPQLERAGGFRLDDPAGDVGIELIVVADVSTDPVTYYHVPLSYRGSALPAAGSALIGTAEHGVLGRRWIYDGTHDPVVVDQLLALLSGDAEPQAQSESETADLSVLVTAAGAPRPPGAQVTAVGLDLTTVLLGAGSPATTIEVIRALRETPPQEGPADEPRVSAPWRAPSGAELRGDLLVLRD
jgi:hypothetical protein